MIDPSTSPAGDLCPTTSIERRAWVRYGTDLDASCHPADRPNGVGWAGKVANVSAGGIGLLLRHRFEPGTPLLVQLAAAEGGWQRTVAVRVRHATAVVAYGDLCWLMGCAFASPLSEAEVLALCQGKD